MSRSLLIVGAGLSGLFAAVHAARRGASVRLIAEGRGGLALCHGCIDVWHDGDIRFALGRLDREHPLRLAGREALEQALEAFLHDMQACQLPFAGSLDRTWRLPTAVGSVHETTAAPVSMTAGSLDDPGGIHLGQLTGLRDFSAHLAAAGLRSMAVEVRGTIELPLPSSPTARDLYASEIALALEEEGYRHEVARLWKPKTAHVRRLGLPAVLGRERSLEVFAGLEHELGLDLFEIPTLPPSLPGLRIEQALRRLAVQTGVDIIEGPGVR
ncbi:MAG TPA: FAD-binding protein, partial [Anaerolineales bacterium]|nr:FAD-binding protein [Anaerolineales bacterium]